MNTLFALKFQMKLFELESYIKDALKNKVYRLSAFGTAFIGCAYPVFAAANDNMFSEFVDQLVSLYKSMVPVINVCTLIFLVFAIAAHYLTSDQQKSKMWKDVAIKVVIGFAIIIIAPWILVKTKDFLGTSMTSKSITDVKNIK